MPAEPVSWRSTASFPPGETPLQEETPQGPGASTTIDDAPTGTVSAQILVGRTFGNYEILEELGRGGMGVVYRARHLTTSRCVALKVMRNNPVLTRDADLSPEQRFRVEINAASKLEHEHIVRVYDAGAVDGRLYYSMQLVEGLTLDELIQKSALDDRRAARIGLEMARAIQFAHDRGVLHRDLKPRNILVESPRGRALVTDFGLAKLAEIDGEITRTGHIVGTPLFMAPEQARDSRKVTTAADTYSLGAVLYAMLTGRPPLRAETYPELLQKLQVEPPASIRESRPRVAKDLETICLKCLEKEPQRRYASARALAEDLERFLDGRPISARPLTAAGRLWRLTRRHPRVIALIFTLVLVSAFALGVGLQYRQTLVQRDAARAATADAQQATAVKRRALAQSFVDKARLSMSRGKAREALALYEQALKEGYENRIEIELEQVAAWVALSQSERARSAVDALAQRSDLGPHQAMLRLWQAEFALAHSSDEAIRHYEQALALGLPPAERLYAEGMLAETTPAALAKFDAALAIAPFHERSMGMSAYCLIAAGRTQEAERRLEVLSGLNPENSAIAATRAALLALRGSREEAHRIADDQRLFPEAIDRQNLHTIIDLVDDSLGRLSLLPEQSGPDFTRQVPRVIALLRQWQPLMGVQESGLHLPPKVAKRFDGLLFALGALVIKQYWIAEPRIREILEVNPEGTLYLLHGSILGAQDKLSEAEQSFERAANTPSLMPRGNRDARVSYAVLLAYRAAIREPHDAQAVAPAIGLIADLLDDEPLPADCYLPFALAAIEGRDVVLARRLVERWQKVVKADDVHLLRRQRDIEWLDGNYLKAYEVAERLLAIEPDNAETKRIREESLKKWRELKLDRSAD